MLHMRRSRVPIVLLASVYCPIACPTGCDIRHGIELTPHTRQLTDLQMDRIRSIHTGARYV